MSLALIEGWDSLAAITDKYNIVGSAIVDPSIKRTGNQSLKTVDYTDYCILPMPSAQDTYIFGAALYIAWTSSLFYNAPAIIFKRVTVYNINIHFFNGQIFVYRDSTLLAISDIVFVTSSWFYLEIKATCKNSISADEFIIKVNGVEVTNLAAATDTQAGPGQGIDSIVLAGNYPSGSINYDDLYICDLLGGINDDFLGDCKVETLYPDGNGNTSDFTGSDADSVDNYLHVDEAQQDGDVSYVEDSTVNNLDLYTFDGLVSSPATIHGVGTRSYAKKDDAGVRTGKLQCRSGSTNYEGDEISLGSDYLGYDEIWDKDPDTAVAWDVTGVDAAEFGIKVQS